MRLRNQALIGTGLSLLTHPREAFLKLDTSHLDLIFTHVDLSEAVVEGPHIEIGTLVNESPLVGILWVEFVVLAVLVDEVRADCPALVEIEAAIINGRHATPHESHVID